MNEQLIQSITTYTSSLEQQLAALEARVAKMEEAHEVMKRESEDATALIASLQAEIEALKVANIVSSEVSAEPEIEIELVMDDEVLDTLETLDVLEEIEDTTELESVVEPVVEPVVEEPAPVVEEEPEVVIVEEPQQEPVAEPEIKAEPAPRAVPQQTSLFGSAVSDIRQAISLGDRFLFQRELFAGNGELMQQTLDELNALGSLNEAMEYVQENFEWDKESTAVQLFENVLKRRFS